MNSVSQWTWATIVLVAALLLGAWWGHRAATRANHRSKQLPVDIKLRPRTMLRPAEREIWLWLRQVFSECHVMVKVPITRFTMPRDLAEARSWFHLLNGVYCSFTVCDDEGRALGCVDVLGERQMSSGNQSLKQKLLRQCRIGYLTVTPENMPEAEAIRIDFLGIDRAMARPQLTDMAELQAARDNLVEVLDRNRSYRRSQLAPLDELDSGGRPFTSWAQPDSLSLSSPGALSGDDSP